MRNFDAAPLTVFRQAVDALEPGAGGRAIVRLLDGRAKRTTVLAWKAGRAHAPRWALDLLAAKIQVKADALQAIADDARMAPERPGLKAGARNLAVYLANRNR